MSGEIIHQGFLRTNTGSSQSNETDRCQCRQIDQVRRHGSNWQETRVQSHLSGECVLFFRWSSKKNYLVGFLL